MVDNYKQLSLGRYLEILAVNKDESLDFLDRQIKILSILSDMPEDEVAHLPLAEYKRMVMSARFLEGEDKSRHIIAKKYILGGMELVPVTDYRKVETCQYVDFQTFVADMETRMVELLSVMLIPKGHRYNEGYDILEVQRAIRDYMSVTDAVTLCAFFLTSLKKLIKDSLNYCKSEVAMVKDKERRREMMERVERMEALLRESGDG